MVQAQPVGLKLSAGHGEAAPPVSVVTGQPLDRADVDAVIKRLPVWTADSTGATPFRWPTKSLAAPQPGKTVPVDFPAGGRPKPPATVAGPLHVVRMQPQGAVSIAPFVSITFDQPMVPVTTVGQLAGARVPATIAPKLAGTWEWIGTSTLRFAADSTEVDRLPMATEFTVTVPAGTRSTAGGTLAKAEKFTFTTPPPTVLHFQPSGASLKLSPVFLAVFDQRVDPAVVLRSVTLTAGDTAVPVRLATAGELAADADRIPGGRVRPDRSGTGFPTGRNLPVDVSVTVRFGVGTPSAEGPRTTTKAAVFTGHTYSALTLVKKECGYGDSQCLPGSPIILTFSNSIDQKAFDPTAIQVSPAIPGGATVNASDRTIVVQGATAAESVYTITVPTTVVDVYGQKLATSVVATVRIGKATPRLDPFAQPITTVDPMVATPSITVELPSTAWNSASACSLFPPRIGRSTSGSTCNRGSKNCNDGKALKVPSWPVLEDRVVPITGPRSQLVSTI